MMATTLYVICNKKEALEVPLNQYLLLIGDF